MSWPTAPPFAAQGDHTRLLRADQPGRRLICVTSIPAAKAPPDGRVQPLTHGIVRARYRDSFEKATLLESGTIYRYEIDLWVTTNLFRQGHQVRVEISSSNFPFFSRNLNTGRELGWETQAVIARQKIYHDAAHPSHLLLPVIPQE